MPDRDIDPVNPPLPGGQGPTDGEHAEGENPPPEETDSDYTE